MSFGKAATISHSEYIFFVQDFERGKVQAYKTFACAALSLKVGLVFLPSPPIRPNQSAAASLLLCTIPSKTAKESKEFDGICQFFVFCRPTT